MAFREHANTFGSFTEGFMTKKECAHLLQLSTRWKISSVSFTVVFLCI